MTATLSPLQDAVIRGRAWNAVIDAIDPTGADDQFFHIKNNGSKTLAVAYIEIESTAAGDLELHECTGSPGNSPTTLAPANLGKSSAGPVALVSTGVDLALSLGTKIWHHKLFVGAAGNQSIFTYGGAGILIPSGQGFCLNWEAATGALTGNVTFYELPENLDG